MAKGLSVCESNLPLSFLLFSSPSSLLSLSPFSHVLRFLAVVTALQWDSVFVCCHPLASVLSELSVLHGVWTDVSPIDPRWDTAVQWRCRQWRFPGYKYGGQICRIQIWLWLWRSCHKVFEWCILFCVDFYFLPPIFSNYIVTNVIIFATGVKSRLVWTHGMSCGCLAPQRVESYKWTARSRWKELLRSWCFLNL